MRRFISFIIVASAMAIAIQVKGENDIQQKESIVDYMRNDSVHPVVIEQPSGLNQLLISKKSKEDIEKVVTKDGVKKIQGGYRIQVFSDNNSRTARSEALRKQNEITTEFPVLSTYITYKAPAWRLRVGDFETVEEAVEMLNEIKEIFPDLARELTIVRDRIILVE